MTLIHWLIIYSCLILLAILIDGVRRMFLDQRYLNLDIEQELCDLPDQNLASELPNGSARRVNATKTQAEDKITKSTTNTPAQLTTLGSAGGKPESLKNIELISANQANTLACQLGFTEAKSLGVNCTSAAIEPTTRCISTQSSMNAPIQSHVKTQNMTPTDKPAQTTITTAFTLTEPPAATVAVTNPTWPKPSFDVNRPIHEVLESRHNMAQRELFIPATTTALVEPSTTTSATGKNTTARNNEPEIESGIPLIADDILFTDLDLGNADLREMDTRANASNNSKSAKSKNQITTLSLGRKLLAKGRAVANRSAWFASEKAEPLANIQQQPSIVAIRATATHPQGFSGDDLYQLMLACGLIYSDQKFFQRHEDGPNQGPIQFWVANLIEPGTFNLVEIDIWFTRGVTFFMTLPGAHDTLRAFYYMLETAQCLAHNLGGELHDEKHSALCSQTIEHYRQQIREFERRSMFKRAHF
jgi:cell division protein ZipA